MAEHGAEADTDVEESKREFQEMEESSSDDDSDGDIYEVERIIGVTKMNGKTMYKVRWRGYGPSWDTWEPYENLEACVDMIEDYLQRQKQLKLRKKEQSKKKKELRVQTRSNSSDGDSRSSELTPSEKKKPSYFYVASNDEASDTLKDKFWRNLEQGKVDVFACGDLYTRVKGTGRSSRPTSFKEDEQDFIATGHRSSTGSADKPKKKRAKTTEMKDGAMEGSSERFSPRSREKKGKKPGRKKSLDGGKIGEGVHMSGSGTESLGDIASQRRLSESSSCVTTDSNSRLESMSMDVDMDMHSVASSSDTMSSVIGVSDDHSSSNTDIYNDSNSTKVDPDSDQRLTESDTSREMTDRTNTASPHLHQMEQSSNTAASVDQDQGKELLSETLCDQQMEPTDKANVSCDSVNNNLFALDTRNEEDTACEFDLDDLDSSDWEKKETEKRLLNDSLELTNAEFRQAVRDGNYDRVRRALKSKRQYNLETADNLGYTLAMCAAQNGYDDILELLILSGANINAQQKNGFTALMHACEQGHLCTVALLLELGAHMNLQQNSGESALMKAVKRGHKEIVHLLLEHGVNFATRSLSENTALKIARLHNFRDTQNLINEHISKVTAAFESQVCITLNNTARILCALFPIQCFSLNEAEKFHISFKHELQPTIPGVGMLLFIAHARINRSEIRCRLYGPCAVTSAVLNGIPQSPLTEEANFVLSLSPLANGKNDLEINVVRAPNSKAKLVVCAYKAQLTIPPD